MKKLFALVMATITLFILTSCFKSEEAQAVDDMISAIGTVSLNNEKAIIDVEEVVDALDKKTKRQLDNLDDLKAARDEYNSLLIKSVENEIDAIGTVTDKSEYKISVARKKYDELRDELKPSVKNYSVLTDSEDALVSAKAAVIDNLIDSIKTVTLKSWTAIDKAQSAYNKAAQDVKNRVKKYDVLQNVQKEFSNLKVQEVIESISSIGTVSLNKKELIDEARKLYSALSYDQKALVSNYSILTTAENTLKDLTAKALTSALAKMRKETDEVRGLTWYHSKTQPYYVDTRSYVLPYIALRDYSSSPILLVRFNYTGDKWVFFEKVTLMVDGKRYYKTFNYFDMTRDNGGGDVWEYAHIENPSSSDIDMLWAIANSTKTIIRFEGDDRYRDITVSQADKNAIKEVLNVYEMMKNS